MQARLKQEYEGDISMVRKKFKRIGKRLFRPIPGSPALFGEVGKDLRNSRNRLSNLEIEGIREKKKRRKK